MVFKLETHQEPLEEIFDCVSRKLAMEETENVDQYVVR